MIPLVRVKEVFVKHYGKAAPVVSVNKGRSRVFQQEKTSNAKTLFMVQLLFSLVTMLVKKALGMLRTVTYGETVNDTS